jgi:hypothetical protein
MKSLKPVLLRFLEFSCLDADCVFVGFKFTACPRGVDLGEFGAEKEDLGRIVNPQ